MIRNWQFGVVVRNGGRQAGPRKCPGLGNQGLTPARVMRSEFSANRRLANSQEAYKPPDSEIHLQVASGSPASSMGTAELGNLEARSGSAKAGSRK